MIKYITILLAVALFSCNETNNHSTEKEEDSKKEVVIDENINGEESLGAHLFFDPILSEDKTISCASCHNPKFAFADNKPLSVGVHGRKGTRNAPAVMNMASRRFFFHDGRASSLEEQALGPIENPVEMNLSYSEAVKRVQENEAYQYYFNKVYQSKPDSALILKAIAQFERSLESDGSAIHDKWMNGEDTTNQFTESQKRGRIIFMTKGKCFDCHFSPDFTTDEFRNIGLYDGDKLNDVGRFGVTKDSADLGKFKVPGLRNVALTAPYMHNGMFATLEEVIEYYNNPYAVVQEPINIDTLMQPLDLTQQEKDDLLHFLESLTDENIPYLKN